MLISATVAVTKSARSCMLKTNFGHEEDWVFRFPILQESRNAAL
jgi:hypothetical protein